MTDFTEREMKDGSIDVHNEYELKELIDELAPGKDDFKSILITPMKKGYNVEINR